MSLIRGFIDRLLLVCAIVAGGLVPGFIAQYRQPVGGPPPLASRDPTFHSEGGALQALVASVQHLQSEVAALQGTLFQQAAYLSLHADPDVARATLTDWGPTFGLSAEGIVFALAFAACVWLIFQASWSLTAAGGRRLAARSRPPKPQPAMPRSGG